MNKLLQLSQILSVVLLIVCTHSTVFGQEKSVQSNATSHSAAPQMPATFPVMQNTGNPDNDAKTYAEAKKAWIETHKEEYIQMQPGLSEEGRKLLLRGQKKESQAIERKNIQLPSDFPTLMKTGNDKVDSANLETQKMQWIQNNWEDFEKMDIAQKETLFGKGFEVPILVRREIEKIRNEKKALLKERAEMTSEHREKLLWILEHQEDYRNSMSLEEANKYFEKVRFLLEL